MEAIRREILHPSGAEYAVYLRLKPTSSFRDFRHPSTDSSRLLKNLVVARSNHLRIYELRQEQWEPSLEAQYAREKQGGTRPDTEAVEGEVEMDAEGEGFVNIGTVRVSKVARMVDNLLRGPYVDKWYYHTADYIRQIVLYTWSPTSRHGHGLAEHQNHGRRGLGQTVNFLQGRKGGYG